MFNIQYAKYQKIEICLIYKTPSTGKYKYVEYTRRQVSENINMFNIQDAKYQKI